MADSGKPIADYSDSEIREALIACGQSDVPAVTSLTRPILQRKLEKLRNGSPFVQQQLICGNAAPGPAAVETVSHGESTHSHHDEEPEGYYGVAAAPNEQSLVPLSPYYTSKKEVLLAIKGSKLKGARFKRFESPQCAEAYSRQYDAEAGASVESDTPTRPSTSSEVTLKSERANAYPGLKQQDHTALRQLIEAGDTDAFAKAVWENPRHLVTAGDTPEVLQPGNRYNAIHLAVRKGQLDVCKKLFSIVESDDFWKLLYPDDLEEVRQDRKRRLIDLYLNVPDKTGETALHLACKFGMEHIVSYLVTFPQLDVAAKNSQGLKPAEVIPAQSPVKQKMISTLQEPEVYYVPVLRTVDNSSPPSVGPPSRLTDPNTGTPPRPLEGGPLCTNADDVISRAFAGPMSPSKAAEFYREWRSPSREKEKHTNARRTDSERGLERVGRHIAHQQGVGWSEYWEFLGCYTDLSKDEGMSKLEDYLAKKLPSPGPPSPSPGPPSWSGFHASSVHQRPSTSSSSMTSVHQRPSSSSTSACRRAIPCKLFAEECKNVPVGSESQDEHRGEGEGDGEHRGGGEGDSEHRSGGEGDSERRCGGEADSEVLTLSKEDCSLSSSPPLSQSSPPLSPSSLPPPLPTQALLPPSPSSPPPLLTQAPPSSPSSPPPLTPAHPISCHMESASSCDVELLMNSLSALDLSKGVVRGGGGSPCVASGPACTVNGEAIVPPGTAHQCLPTSNPSSVLPGTPPIFLAGSHPTKLDCDVKLALCDAEVDAARYPHVFRWLTQIRSYSEQEQKSWSTPGSKPASVYPVVGRPLVFSSPPPPLQSPPVSRRTPHTPRVPRTTPVHHHLSRSSMIPRLLM